MPSASDTIATTVTNGVLKRVRRANRRLGIRLQVSDCSLTPVDDSCGGMVYRLGPMDVSIRSATERDVPLILELIRGLAEYERLAHEVTATEATLRRALFGPKPGAEVIIAEAGGEA